MYVTGDLVVYGFHGVCRVANLEKQRMGGKTVTYLVLEPVNQEGSRFLVPLRNAVAMAKVRPLMTKEELLNLIESTFIRDNAWIADENSRKLRYRELINSSNRAELMQMVRTLYIHKSASISAGRKIHLADENFLRDAEKLLASEISVILGITQEESRAYLRERLKQE